MLTSSSELQGGDIPYSLYAMTRKEQVVSGTRFWKGTVYSWMAPPSVRLYSFHLSSSRGKKREVRLGKERERGYAVNLRQNTCSASALSPDLEAKVGKKKGKHAEPNPFSQPCSYTSRFCTLKAKVQHIVPAGRYYCTLRIKILQFGS